MFHRIGRIAKNLATRGYAWTKLEESFKKSHPYCGVCLTNKKLEVHHVMPWHDSVEGRLDKDNLITLCHHDHFAWGHSWNTKDRFNKEIINDAANFSLRMIAILKENGIEIVVDGSFKGL